MNKDKIAANPGSSTHASTAPGSTNSSDDSEIRSAEDVLFRRMLRTPQPIAPGMPGAAAAAERAEASGLSDSGGE